VCVNKKVNNYGVLDGNLVSHNRKGIVSKSGSIWFCTLKSCIVPGKYKTKNPIKKLASYYLWRIRIRTRGPAVLKQGKRRSTLVSFHV